MKILRLFLITVVFLVFAFSVASAECEKGIDLYNKGTLSTDIEEKIALFEEALTQCDDKIILARIHNNLGDACDKIGNQERAIQEYLKSIECDKEYALPYFGLGDIYYNRKDYINAIEYYDAGLYIEHDELIEKKRNYAQAIEPYSSTTKIVNALDPERTKSGLQPIVDILIEFDSDSDRISASSDQQIKAVASALNNEILKGRRYMLGYKTKVKGDVDKELMSRRLNSILKCLEEKYGIPSGWFDVKGKLEGESAFADIGKKGRKDRINVIIEKKENLTE